MKILYVHYLGPVNSVSVGPSVHIREFSKAMSELGHTVCLFPPLEYGEDGGVVRVKWKSRYFKQFKNLFQNIPAFIRERREIKCIQPDVMITRYSLYRFSTLLLSKLKKIPVILEVNAPMAYEMRKFQKEFVYLPFLPEWVERQSFQAADALIVVSEELKNYIVRQGVTADKIAVVPNGVDMARFQKMAKSEEILNRYSIAQNSLVVGFTGSFNHWHAVDSMLDAFAKLVQKYPHLVLLLVGDGFGRPALEEKVKAMHLADHVVFTGLVPHDEIPRYLAVMDIMIAPYPALDFFYFSPLKIFEYMAMGKPVIAPAIGQINLLIDHGMTGLLYPVGDQASMEKAFAIVIEDGGARKKMGEEARKAIMLNYTWQKTAEKITTLCQKLIK